MPRPPGRAPSGTVWSERQAAFVPVDHGALVVPAIPAVARPSPPLHPTMPTRAAPADMKCSAVIQLQRDCAKSSDSRPNSKLVLKRSGRSCRSGALPHRSRCSRWCAICGSILDGSESKSCGRSFRSGAMSLALANLCRRAHGSTHCPRIFAVRFATIGCSLPVRRLLPAALRIVREERRAAGLSVFDRAPKKHGWRRVSGLRADGRRVLHS